MQNNDPSKPTCRVVKRQGQRGARIHPRGCQVRAEVDLVPAELRAEGSPPAYFDRDERKVEGVLLMKSHCHMIYNAYAFLLGAST